MGVSKQSLPVVPCRIEGEPGRPSPVTGHKRLTKPLRSRLPQAPNGLLLEPRIHHELHGETTHFCAVDPEGTEISTDCEPIMYVGTDSCDYPSSGSGKMESGMREVLSKEMTVPKNKGKRNTENRS
jgi:hypothetical protein